MKNKVFMIGFPKEFSTDTTNQYYEITFVDYPIEEYMLCLANSIFFYKQSKPLTKLNFPGILVEVDDDFFKYLSENTLASLDEYVGRERKVNSRQFELIKGTVVRSKVNPAIGPGVVVSVEDENATVKFTNAEKYFNKDIIICHSSTLRVITHIKEVKNNE